jgi:sigma-B regulation protein RsbU (phosphoserine phosphatase)
MAWELGGDFYRLQFIRKDYCLAGCFDVAGKDLSAALITSCLAAFFETLRLFKFKGKAEELNSGLNALIRTLCPGEIFVASALIYADFKKHCVEIHNFGFPPLWIFTEKDKEPLPVPASYPPLGIEEEPGAGKAFVMPLKKNLRIALFSDGLADMKNPQGASYGVERCLGLLKKLYGPPDAAGFDANTEDEIQLWCGKVPPRDDITVGEIRINGV